MGTVASAPTLTPFEIAQQKANELAIQSDVDVLFYVGPIKEPFDKKFAGEVAARPKRKDLLFILCTFGGDANAAYRMARTLQRSYKKGSVRLLVHSYCKSAGTLLALSANELIMCDLAELGPLDVQILKQDELAERISGLTPIQALNSLRSEAFNQFEHFLLELRRRSGFQISTRTAADVATRMAIGTLRPIYEQIDPLRVGEMQRAMMIAHQYGMRLSTENVRSGALNQLIAGYPSHDFIIDRQEAEKVLFKAVKEPSSTEQLIANALACFMQDDVIMAEEPLWCYVNSEKQQQKSDNGISNKKEKFHENGDSTRPVESDAPESRESCGSADVNSEQESLGSDTEATSADSAIVACNDPEIAKS